LAAGWLHVVLSKGGFMVLDCRVGDELENMAASLDGLNDDRPLC
jgi:hypothetical protein